MIRYKNIDTLAHFLKLRDAYVASETETKEVDPKKLLSEDIVVIEDQPAIWVKDKLIVNNSDLLWYGVRFDLGKNDGSPDGVRIGNLALHKSLPILSKMRGCTIDDKDNTIKYLNPDDWKKYVDSEEEVKDPDGSHLNFFVEIPEHYRLFLLTPDNNIEIRISEYNLPGYAHIAKQYVGAYEATTDPSYQAGTPDSTATNLEYKVLWSRPDWLKPVVSMSRKAFQDAARKSLDIVADGNNRTNNWNMYTYEAHTAITWLFVVEYATLNSLKDFKKALTPEGYHQGGLGKGVTTGIPTSNTYSWIPAGVTHVLGSNTGIVCYDNGSNGGTVTQATACTGCDKSETGHFKNSNKSGYTECTATEVPRYRGIENPFGHVWKNTIDVIITGEDNKPHNVYVCKDYTKFNGEISLTIQTASATQSQPQALPQSDAATPMVIAAAAATFPPEGYELQPFKDCCQQGYLKELVGTNFGDLFCKECNGGDGKYYSDYHWTYISNGSTTAHTLLIGGLSDLGTVAGLFYLHSSYRVDHSYVDAGTRLTFYGEPNDTKAAAAKAMAYASQPRYDLEYGLGMGDEEYNDLETHSDSYVMSDDESII